MRFLRPHQRPWLHPAVYADSEADRFERVHTALNVKSADLSFVECLVVFGGDRGFHIECRLIRNRVGDWLYELDCHEQPCQTLLIDDVEISEIAEQVRRIHQSVEPGETGITHGPDPADRVPCLWYHARHDRLVWLTRFKPLQETVIDRLIQIHRRLELPFPEFE